MESTFQIAICECPDVSASTMALDASGRYALISGRKSMALIDLDSETNPNSSVTSQLSPGAESELASNKQELIAGAPTRRGPVCKKMVRNSKYEPTACQFSRHMMDLFALTSYQVVEVFSIDDLNPQKPKMTLRGHSRAITDVEWSCFDPYMLGSSAGDCLTNLWDIRDYRRPSATLSSVSGATQVRFSKTSSNLIATSHEIDVRIWDIRQQNLPLYYIAAHLQKINGMDWNSNKTSCDQEQLITCSQDNTIKLWDLNSNKIKPSANFSTRTPAWRVRYTPISSNAILTSALPQLRSRGECMALKLWSMKPSRYEGKKLELLLSLVGHTDIVVDFDWRVRPESNPGCEIVSWSKDQTLRVWRIDQQFIEMNVENSDGEAECETNYASTSEPGRASEGYGDETELSPLKTPLGDSNQGGISDTSKSGQQEIQSANDQQQGADTDLDINNMSSSVNELRQEFNLINKNIPNIEFEELNYLRRVCLVTARAKNVACRLRIALPPSYPHSDCPTFTIIDSNKYAAESMTAETKDKLLHLLNETAKTQLGRNRNCLEPCLRKFTAALQKITSHSSYRKRSPRSGIDYKDDPITLSAQRDHSVPFPPTSGATFCGNLLVIFGRPMLNLGSSQSGSTGNTTSGSVVVGGAGTSTGGNSAELANWLVETPRSMAQLSAQLDNMRRQGSYNLSHISISYFYYGAMRRAELQHRERVASQSKTQAQSSNSSTSGFVSANAGSVRSTSKYLSSRTNKSLYHQSIMSKSYKCGPVFVYDATSLSGGVCREMAENYVFDKDVIRMCRRNAEVAAAANRKDLVQIWSLAELSSEGALRSHVPHKDSPYSVPFSFHTSDSDFGDRPWTMHPFGSKLIQSLIDHYVHNCHDVQTAAMLVWTFTSPKLGGRSFSANPYDEICNNRALTTTNTSKCVSNKANTSSYNSSLAQSAGPSTCPGNSAIASATGHNQQMGPATVITTCNAGNIETISGEWNFVNITPEAPLYSNSWSNSTLHEHQHQQQHGGFSSDESGNAMMLSCCGDSSANISNPMSDAQYERNTLPRFNILSPERSLQNDLIMHVYAELLYRMNLLNQRAMVLKNVGWHSTYSELLDNRHNPSEPVPERLPNLSIKCYNSSCVNQCKSVQCNGCKRYSLYCSICRLPVKGSCSVCLKCLHAGHVNHLDTWFNNNDFCPTGCGCRCLMTVE